MLKKSNSLLKNFVNVRRKFHNETSVIGTTQDTSSPTYQVSQNEYFYLIPIANKLKSAHKNNEPAPLFMLYRLFLLLCKQDRYVRKRVDSLMYKQLAFLSAV